MNDPSNKPKHEDEAMTKTLDKPKTNGSKTRSVIDLTDVQVDELGIVMKVQGLPPGLLLHAYPKGGVHSGANKPKNQKVDPKVEAEKCLYLDHQGRPAIPSRNFQKCISTAVTRFMHGRKGTVAKSTLRVKGMEEPDFCHLDTPGWDVDERMARTSGIGNTPYPCIRPLFSDWTAEFLITYPENHFDDKYIIQAVMWAGKAVGVCDYRPEKGGDFGCFKVMDVKGVKV